MMKITVKGLVQGIGFRPFVAELAEELKIRGIVRNTFGVVTILAQAEAPVLEQFRNRLISDCPRMGFIDELLVEEIPENRWKEELGGSMDADITQSILQGGFHIIESNDEKLGLPRIPVDLPTCDRCLHELFDPSNRRYRHPFISCVSCGPRYSIIERLAYDRDTITMKDFAMCPDCEKEYAQKGNIRRHAQTIACKSCGPKLCFQQIRSDASSNSNRDEEIIKDMVKPLMKEAAFEQGVKLLQEGGILAIKDIGGYHLACRMDNTETIRALRKLKGREKKPFAILYPDVLKVKEDCFLNEQEEREIQSVPRPIVLCRRKTSNTLGGRTVSEELMKLVCGKSPDLGAMLPCNPLQVLLMKETGPLIMTSANRTHSPMIIDDEDLLHWLVQMCAEFNEDDAQVPMGIWSHERRILVPLDDSVVRTVGEHRQIVRRARGFAPNPIMIQPVLQPTTLAMGGDLKATFAYAAGNMVVCGPQLGDLEETGCHQSYEKELERVEKLFACKPQRIVTDAHPGYFSKDMGNMLAKKNSLPVYSYQHHHCHAASVIAEHGLSGQIFSVVMDGTGYGLDGTIWGGEIFLCNTLRGNEMKRIAHLKTVSLLGGNESAKNCENILYAFLSQAKEKIPEEFFAMVKRHPLDEKRFQMVKKALSMHLNEICSSSTGRLFDAAAALLGICLYNDYEGEAPMELEYTAVSATEAYPLKMFIYEEDGVFIGDTVDFLLQLLKGVMKGASLESLARGFIDGIAGFIYDVLERMNFEKKPLVTLSGGTFLNRILTERMLYLCKKSGYEVYMNEQVPCGDGGIALGQLWMSAQEEVPTDKTRL